MHVEPGRTYIRKLSVRSAPCDTLSLRIHLARLLAGGELQPDGLSPSAILCVRTLRDPLPGTVQWQHERLGLPQAWEQALRSTLARIAHQAVRPAFAAVATDAQAVLFVDRAEMLACLARDWCEGSVIERWWWQGLFKGTDLTAAVLHAWLETPPYVPAALQQLSEWKVAVPFVRAIGTVEVGTLLQGIAQIFSLTELQSILSFVLGEDSHGWRNDVRETRNTAMASAFSPQSSVLSPPPPVLVTSPPPPWHRWVPEAQSTELRLDQQFVLAVGLMLHRAPLVVRSSSFVESVQRWTQTEQLPLPLRSDDTPVAASVSTNSGQTEISQRATRGPEHSPSSLLLTQEKTLSVSADHDKGSETAQKAGGEHSVTMPGVMSPDRTERVITQSHSAEPPMLTETARASASPTVEEMSEVTRRGASEIETAFGGVFYLVNLGLFLELYGDFTNPLRPGIALPLWDFVALVGRKLVGSELEDDPAWVLLAELAGRTDGQEPGKGFTPPEQTLETRPVGLSDLVSSGQEEDEKLEHGNAPLLRWLDWLMPSVRIRLQQALGLAVQDDLAAVLCHHWARVTATLTHVDVYLSLADLPISIRLAGLDRDPGWVPAAGRFIAFHFD